MKKILVKVNLKGEKSHISRLKIQDDDDGHLIYVPGDVLKSRCKYCSI